MAKQTITYAIQGSVTGELWWPRVAASKAVEFRWQAGEYDSLRAAAEALMRREDGDFSTAARLTADSMLIVQRNGPHGRSHTHCREITNCPSIEDYVASEVFASVAGDEF